MTVLKFPHDASRRLHSRKPRRSKNGTPAERAAKAAAMLSATAADPVVHIARLRIDRAAAATARIMALYDRLDPARQAMFRDALRDMVENRGSQP